MNKAPYLIVITLLIVLVTNNNFVLDIRNLFAAGLSNVVSYVGSGSELKEEIVKLKIEKENLQARIFEITVNPNASQSKRRLLEAKVYSSYPLNTKSEITIAGGEDKGLKVDMPVVLESNILIGKIKQVFPDTSVVTTIFDPKFEISARIGVKEIDALFKGGVEPKVELIARDALVNSGEIVAAASSDFPYALKLGEVEIIEGSGGPFRSGLVKPSYTIGDLREVMVITDFETE
ncbi:MAG: hypothetical protein A3F24_01100 [Candidatus Colwellbacteria bacterium RIFCSPHIGHO2_12_FULL_44_17]|uniref:Cell shape-determining protein MreC n=2 Tax=Candidatus Colwelliibacteriota TaxID=1817904 RepID=A0A1G1Z8A9_9BACT|nr:MAG: hypothetical protein A3F24_01100 [Candidatus Colwellbacteria bacterium RIFCSPHIGHO2_12_FULL_44_17]OGY60885.1 MAG: hypothetical protein A3I31_00790 [Candidatus Colwellbacteria bacterium RIFCSPLOWO2_02_FULL_44_20b]